MLVADYGRGTTSAADVRAALAEAPRSGGLGPAPARRRPGALARLVTPNGAEAARVAAATVAAATGWPPSAPAPRR